MAPSRFRSFCVAFSLFFSAGVLLLAPPAHAQVKAGRAEVPRNSDGSANDDGSSGNDANEALKKLNEQMKCRSKCQRDSFSCMGACPNGGNGASCRANCQLESSNCSQSCD
jgi:hypothetical protein